MDRKAFLRTAAGLLLLPPAERILGRSMVGWNRAVEQTPLCIVTDWEMKMMVIQGDLKKRIASTFGVPEEVLRDGPLTLYRTPYADATVYTFGDPGYGRSYRG